MADSALHHQSNLDSGPDSEPPAPFIDRYLAYLLARASHRISSGFHRRLAEIGVSVSTWRIVASLQLAPLSVGELAERVLIEAALNATAGRKRDAADKLGWGRNTLTRKLKEYGIS